MNGIKIVRAGEMKRPHEGRKQSESKYRMEGTRPEINKKKKKKENEILGVVE